MTVYVISFWQGIVEVCTNMTYEDAVARFDKYCAGSDPSCVRGWRLSSYPAVTDKNADIKR